MSLLEIENLSLAIGSTPILNGIDLSIEPGKIMALVGESGSGKSITALSIMQLLPQTARTTGSISFKGTNLLHASEIHMCSLRGNKIGMVFQEPMTALNPLKTIGEQVAEGIYWHRRTSRSEAQMHARAMLDRVGLPETEFFLSRYPHELSGGQRQRVIIAIACALKPQLLIADEPTTALDVVLQAQVLDLLRDLVVENNMGLLLISHDLAVVAEMADHITILRHGKVLETGKATQVLSQPAHPYTRQLAQASTHVPEIRTTATAFTHNKHPEEPLLVVENLTRVYPGQRRFLFSRSNPIRAVDNVSFAIAPGRSVALVGRSGCGKSTLARMVLALDQPSSGEIYFRGKKITGKNNVELKSARRDMQVVFQDPYGSFDPRQRVEKLVTEPLHLLEKQPTRTQRRDMAAAALAEVGLGADALDKFPHEFSGGQRQRISIARAIITRPRLVVADEPVSALDVSIRARILDLFADLNARLGIAWLFITHDLNVARAISDEVMVMDKGRIVERGHTSDILNTPRSGAAQALIAAAPDLNRALARRLGKQG